MSLRKVFAAAAVVVLPLFALPSVAVATPTYAVSWNGGANVRGIYAVQRPLAGGFYDATQYYAYNAPYGASSNTPDNLEMSNTISLFLFQDGLGNLSLFQISDKPNDGSGSRLTTTITSNGLAGTGQQFIVQNDPGDGPYAWNDATGSATINQQSWPCCNDGFVLGYLPSQSGDGWDLTLHYSDVAGLSALNIYTLNDSYANGGPFTVIQSFNIPFGQDVTFSRLAEQVASVPAPAGLPFLALAVGGLAVRRRRRMAKA